VADLDQITTLGFRGEALASVAAVSQVTVLTVPANKQLANCSALKAVELHAKRAMAATWHTRYCRESVLQHAGPPQIPSPTTDRNRSYPQLVTHCALAYPKIRFSLSSEERQIFQSTGNGNLYDVMITMYGLEVAEKMLEIERDGEPAGTAASAPPLLLSLVMRVYCASPC